MKRLFTFSLLFCCSIIFSQNYASHSESVDIFSSYHDHVYDSDFNGYLYNTQIMVENGSRLIQDLIVGDFVLGKEGGRQKVVDIKSRQIDQAWYYALTTEQHGFYIYPGSWVHNLDLIVSSSIGWYALGAIEFATPAILVSAGLLTLFAYAVKELPAILGLSVSQVEAMQNPKIISKTREHYLKKRAFLLQSYQEIANLKDALSLFLGGNYQKMVALTNILSISDNHITRLLPIAPIDTELKLSCYELDNLFKIREQELDELELACCDVEIALSFHLIELIEYKNRAWQKFCKCSETANSFSWIEKYRPLDVIHTNTFFDFYKTNLFCKVAMDNLSIRLEEIDAVCSFYIKNRENLFTSRVSNVLRVLEGELASLHDCRLTLHDSYRAVGRHIYIAEKILNRRRVLSNYIVSKFLAEANNFVNDGYDINVNRHREKKKKAKQKIDQKNKNKELKSGVLNGMPDPEDEEEFKKNILMEDTSQIQSIIKIAEG